MKSKYVSPKCTYRIRKGPLRGTICGRYPTSERLTKSKTRVCRNHSPELFAHRGKLRREAFERMSPRERQLSFLKRLLRSDCLVLPNK